MKNIKKTWGVIMASLLAICIIASCSEDDELTVVEVIPGTVDGSVSSTSISNNESVTFTDLSTKVLTRTWTFSGAEPASSSDSIVTVSYAYGGTFTAELTIKHIDNSTQTKEFAIDVDGPTGPSQTPFSGTPVSLPGIIQFEDYDIGGEGVAFHDTEEENRAETAGSATYRDDDGIDIQVSADGTLINIGYSGADEWMEYTVNVTAAGNYYFDFAVASGSDIGGSSVKIQLQNGENFTDLGETGNFANTGGWGTYTSLIVADIPLEAGEQILRFYLTGGGVNLDKVEVVAGDAPDPEPEPEPTERTGSLGLFSETTTVESAYPVTIQNNQMVEISTVDTDAYEGNEAYYFKYVFKEGGYGLHATLNADPGPLDATGYEDGFYNVAIKTTSLGKVKIRMRSGSTNYWVMLDDAVKTYGLERDGQWHALKIPVSDFKADDRTTVVNLDALSNVFVLRSDEGSATPGDGSDYDFYVDDIYFSLE